MIFTTDNLTTRLFILLLLLVTAVACPAQTSDNYKLKHPKIMRRPCNLTTF